MSDRMVGWERIGDALSGGERRKQIQKLDAAKAGLEYDVNTQAYKPMAGSDKDLQAQENLMLKQQLQEVQNGLTTSKQWDSIVDSVKTNNFNTFNEQINGDPRLQKIFKQDLGIQAIAQLNAWDNDDQLHAYTKSGMNPEVIDYLKTQRDAILNGKPADMSKDDYQQAITHIGNAYPIVAGTDGTLSATSLDDFLAKTNLIKHSTRTEERKLVLDSIAMGKQALTGITDRAYQATVSSLQGNAKQAEAKGQLDTSIATRGVQANQIMMDAMATGDVNEVMKGLQLTQPEEFLKNTSGPQRLDSYTQAITAFMLGNPNATPEELSRYNARFAEKAITTGSSMAKDKDLRQLGDGRASANDLFTPGKAPVDDKEWKTNARNIQDSIMSDMDEKEKAKVIKASETLHTNNNTASQVENIIKEFEISGKTPKIDKDVVQGTVDWVRTKVGRENAQTLANVDFNTKAGMLLASYIKEMSGTAASDAEVSRLLINLLGGNLTDEVYIKQSMKSFAGYLREKNNIMAEPYKDTIPYDIGETTDLKPKQNKPAASSFWKD